jgi:hypothetical protein
MAISPEITTGEERTKDRSKIYEEQKGLAQDQGEQDRIQRQNVLREVAKQTFANLNSPIALAGVASKAQAAGQMIPTAEQQSRGETALQTATMEGDVTSAQQEQRAKQFMQSGKSGLDRAALEVTRRAFDMGYTAKELALHQNSKIADLAFEQMNKDFQAGRLTEKELQTFARNLRWEAEAMKRDADIELRNATLDFKTMIEEGNAANAKARILAAMERQKEAMKAAARAANTSAIVSGIFRIGGTVIGGIYGGPAGATVGGEIGATAGRAIS